MSKEPKSHPLVYVVTLTWNQRADTLACLKSLSQLNYPEFRVLVVDNCSHDGTAISVQEQFPEVEIITNSENLGFQGGFNQGIDRALAHGADYVLIINNDTFVDPDMLSHLIAQAGQAEVGMLGPKILYADDPERIWSVGAQQHRWTLEMTRGGRGELDLGQWDQVLERDYLVGCALLMSRSFLEQVGMFDCGFHPIYYEDLDLCIRAHKAGFRLFLVPQARMWHKVAARGGGNTSPRVRYLMARNSVRFFRKHVRGWRWLIVIPFRLGSAIRTTARLLFQGNLPSAAAYWRGLGDGLVMPITAPWCRQPADIQKI